jgi:hypothetical protein
MKTVKAIIDIIAIVCTITAIITGINLHIEIHHEHIYNNVEIWNLHSFATIVLTLLLVMHGVQHKFWFKNYTKIIVAKKRVTTCLLICGTVLLVTGIMLFCGSHSNNVSLTHFIAGIMFTIFAIGHVAKRHSQLISLFKR